MNRRFYWFTSIILAMLVGVLGTAYAMQRLQDTTAERVAKDRARLVELDGSMGALTETFRTVSRVVEPSVVHITIKATPRVYRMNRLHPFGQGDPFDEFFREFFERQGMPVPPLYERRSQPEPEDDAAKPSQPHLAPRAIGSGSGWVYDKQGHIVTNYHVVKEADSVEVTFFDQKVFDAQVVATDPRTDIAVLKVDRSDLIPAKLADAPVAQGDIVFAFGSPFRYRFSMSQGIVSGQGRHVGILGADGYEDFIQTDAAINPGNSGGPLTNLRGEVVGMNTAIASTSGSFAGIGFAIPKPMIENVVEQLLLHGNVQRGYLGAYISSDPTLLESFGAEHGVVLEEIAKDSPAEKAGLKRGDVITKMNGERVHSADELRQQIADAGPDTKVAMTILRDGKTQEVTVKLGALESQQARGTGTGGSTGESNENASSKWLRDAGLVGLDTLTPALARQYRLAAEAGVLVRKVRQGSFAAAAGLKPGMVITHVAGEKVTDLASLRTRLEELGTDRPVRMTVESNDGRQRFVVIDTRG